MYLLASYTRLSLAWIVSGYDQSRHRNLQHQISQDNRALLYNLMLFGKPLATSSYWYLQSCRWWFTASKACPGALLNPVSCISLKLSYKRLLKQLLSQFNVKWRRQTQLTPECFLIERNTVKPDHFTIKLCANWKETIKAHIFVYLFTNKEPKSKEMA